MNEQIFFMVFIEGKDNPAHKHTTKESAEFECRRLVKITKRKGYVLKVIRSIELHPEFIENDFIENVDLPF